MHLSYFLIVHYRRYHVSHYAEKSPKHLESTHTGYIASSSTLHTSTCRMYPYFDRPLMKAGSHADSSVPIGGYLCPSCSIRGPQVHHCSEGTLSMTPATCFPQPHQVVLWHESQAAFLHMLKRC